MAMAAVNSVNAYIRKQPAEARAALQRVRETLRKAIPAAEETISYQVPTLKLHGSYVVYFAGWKEHFSLYPASDRMMAAFGDELVPYRVSKGTLRFPLTEPVPVKLIGRIAKFMAAEAAERAEARRSRPAARRPATAKARRRTPRR
jgi:uncharacterized protein YdhG (YjbR/CyaY superfamily)